MARHYIIPLALASTLLVSCAVVPVPPHRVVYREMPPPVYEAQPVAPSPTSNWVPGHYVWYEGAWRWERGHYVVGVVRPMPPLVVEEVGTAPSPRHFYVRGHWRWSGADWVWVRGRWIVS